MPNFGHLLAAVIGMLKLGEFITGYAPPLLEGFSVNIQGLNDRLIPLNDLFDVVFVIDSLNAR